MAEDQLADILLTLDAVVDEHADAFLLDEDKLALSQLLPRIIHERGHFVNITEEALEREIERETTPDAQDGDEGIEDAYPDTQGSIATNDDFFKNKNEVLKHISTALNESSLALDFVSLLISCVRPAAGTISMSAHLKKFIPPSSLNADSVVPQTTPQEKEEKYKEEKNIGQGWKLSSLVTSSENLRNASARLSEEVHREKMFWDIIKLNFNQREILYKTRDKVSGKRLFAVKYGYEDSGSTYRVTGNAVLKPTPDHQVEFVPLSSKVANVKKIIRVRILAKESDDDDDMSVIGESKIDGKFKNDDSIRSQIEKARYFIFEEELFNQLMEEATGLIAYNVIAQNESKISIELQDQSIEIEHVEFDEERSALEEDCPVKPQDSRAEMFATFLRLMLTLKHKKNLDSKRQLNVVKNGMLRGPLKPYALILRPLVGHFRHEHVVQMMHSMVKNVLHNIEDASFKVRRYANLSREQYAMDPFKRMSEPPMSKFVMKVGDSLKIVLQLDSFDFVNFRVKTKGYSKKNVVLDSTLEDLPLIEECLEWLITEYAQS